MNQRFQFSLRRLLWVTVLTAVWCTALAEPESFSVLRPLRYGLLLGVPVALFGTVIGDSKQGLMLGGAVTAMALLLPLGT